MQSKIFKLTTDYIELIKLLKLLQLASSGGEAKMLVESGDVKLNDAVELRKRAKIRKGDIVEFEDLRITIR
jgi:ribosome-associated protein